MAINFRVREKKSTALFYYEHHPKDQVIDYKDIEYTESALETFIEDNRKMMADRYKAGLKIFHTVIPVILDTLKLMISYF